MILSISFHLHIKSVISSINITFVDYGTLEQLHEDYKIIRCSDSAVDGAVSFCSAWRAPLSVSYAVFRGAQTCAVSFTEQRFHFIITVPCLYPAYYMDTVQCKKVYTENNGLYFFVSIRRTSFSKRNCIDYFFRREPLPENIATRAASAWTVSRCIQCRLKNGISL